MPHAVGTVSARIWSRRENRWGESPSLPEGEKADRKRGASPGRESVELCGQDTKGSGRSLRGAELAGVCADDP